jgi:hypothetical protein
VDLSTALIVKANNTYPQRKVSFVILDFYEVFGGWMDKIGTVWLGWGFALACWCLGMDKNERSNKYTLRGEAAFVRLSLLYLGVLHSVECEAGSILNCRILVLNYPPEEEIYVDESKVTQ